MLVKSEGSGICAGDLKNYQGASMYWGGDGMVGICRPPFIPGHEFVGRIVKTGKNVTGFQPGDRVVAEQIVPCGIAASAGRESTGCAKTGAASLL